MEINIDVINMALTFAALCTALYFSRDDKRKREKDEEESQSRLIGGWLIENVEGDEKSRGIESGVYTSFKILNSSSTPIYNLIARVEELGVTAKDRFIPGNSQYTKGIGLVPPGKKTFRIEHPPIEMGKQYNIEIVFSDTANNHWIRFSNGELHKLDVDPITYYGFSLPYRWAPGLTIDD